MSIVRAHVVLPEKLAAEIDKIAGARGRSAFLVEAAEKEIRRIKLQAFLDDAKPAWREDHHADLAETGTAAWVRQQRQRSSTRQLMVESWAVENNL
jgi:metal-responsive CopG/Arc/MetJ family transcriptional regulator